MTTIIYDVEAITRTEWGARPPAKTRTPVAEYDYLEVHHGAGNNTRAKTHPMTELRGYQTLHLDTNGWSDLFYCLAIDKAGKLYDGRSGFQSHKGVWGQALTVVLLGNNDTELVTGAQAATLSDLWEGLKAARNDPNTRLSYHRERATKENKYQSACPGRFGIQAVEAIRNRTTLGDNTTMAAKTYPLATYLKMAEPMLSSQTTLKESGHYAGKLDAWWGNGSDGAVTAIVGELEETQDEVAGFKADLFEMTVNRDAALADLAAVSIQRDNAIQDHEEADARVTAALEELAEQQTRAATLAEELTKSDGLLAEARNQISELVATANDLEAQLAAAQTNNEAANLLDDLGPIIDRYQAYRAQ